MGGLRYEGGAYPQSQFFPSGVHVIGVPSLSQASFMPSHVMASVLGTPGLQVHTVLVLLPLQMNPSAPDSGNSEITAPNSAFRLVSASG